jgi:EAL domain-containing protein (putative c-di-GMP-specific phosphodiesterase class I)
MQTDVVAEGIANKEQEQVALEAGCDGVQGNLYAPPLAAAEFTEFLKRNANRKLADAA